MKICGLVLQQMILLNRKSFRCCVTPGFPLRWREMMLRPLLSDVPTARRTYSVRPALDRSKCSSCLLYLINLVNFAIM